MITENKQGEHWYLIYTKRRDENLACYNLQQQNFNVYLPIMKNYKRYRKTYKEIIEPLFPRYLFVKLNLESDNWGKIRSTRGCVSLVKFGEQWARVSNDFIDKLKHEIDDENKNDHTKYAFQAGEKIEIVAGALHGYQGIVKIQDREQRVTILLDIASGYTRTVQLPIMQIKHVV